MSKREKLSGRNRKEEPPQWDYKKYDKQLNLSGGSTWRIYAVSLTNEQQLFTFYKSYLLSPFINTEKNVRFLLCILYIIYNTQ